MASEGPVDSRAQKVWLTARSKALQAPAIAAAVEQNTLALRGLSEAERAQFLKLTGRVIAAMQGPAQERPDSQERHSAARPKDG